jgi:F-type H+-transporting ATPase subunit delta
LAQRYAEGLGATLERDEDLQGALDEIEAFAGAFESNAELRTALTNPSIPIDTRTSIFREILELPESPSNAQRLIEVLFERRRLDMVSNVAAAFREVTDVRLHRLLGMITTAKPISEEQRDAIERNVSRYMGRDVQLEATTNEAILGGVVVRIGDTVIDGSLQARLAQLKKTLLAEENGQL